MKNLGRISFMSANFVAREVGYRAAFAVESRKLGAPLFEIPRIGLYSSDHAYLDSKLSGLHRRPVYGVRSGLGHRDGSGDHR